MCTKSLLVELQEQDRVEKGAQSPDNKAGAEGQQQKIPPEVVKLLVDMLKPLD